MAAGDPQRVWFEEMLEQLRERWHPDMPFDAHISLRDDLDAMLQRIRLEGKIKSAVVRCRDCGHVGPGATPHVSVRAMILSLNRFGMAPAEQVHALEKRWAEYRKQNDLDLYGKQMGPRTIADSACKHG